MLVQEAKIRGWEGLELQGDKVSIGVAPEIGGRIVSLTYEGQELLFVQKEHEGEVFHFPEHGDYKKLKKEMGFRLWGGDKTWVAPQSAWWEEIPPLDLDAGRYHYQLNENQIIMTSPICHETGLQIVREVGLDGDRVSIKQTFRNPQKEPILRGIWDVTQVLRPFNVWFPISAENVKPYPKEGRSVELKKTLVSDVARWCRIPCHEAIHFKYGALYDPGIIIIERKMGDKTLIWKRSFHADSTLPYAHGACAEVYNSPTYPYLEVEVHAPLEPIEPKQSLSHTVHWEFSTIDGDFTP